MKCVILNTEHKLITPEFRNFSSNFCVDIKMNSCTVKQSALNHLLTWIPKDNSESVISIIKFSGGCWRSYKEDYKTRTVDEAVLGYSSLQLLK